jgi:hypothetical protein
MPLPFNDRLIISRNGNEETTTQDGATLVHAARKIGIYTDIRNCSYFFSIQFCIFVFQIMREIDFE